MSSSIYLGLIMMFLITVLNGVLLAVVSNSDIRNRGDAEELNHSMQGSNKALPNVNIFKRSTDQYRNFSNYFQGKFTSSCKSCGLANTKRKNFMIINGNVVDPPYKYPWMVHIRRHYQVSAGKQMIYSCGGSIISEYYILTAAHCLKNHVGSSMYAKPEDVKVLFLTSTYSFSSGPKVQKVIPHPEYNDRDLKNDIGLLKLKDKIVCDMYKNPICLPPSNLKIPEGQVVKTAGWGKTEKGGSSSKLKEASLKYTKYAKCKRIYHGASEHEGTKYCLEGDKDLLQITCKGDSGGPAFYEYQGTYIIIGALSSGSVGCKEVLPVMYAAVPKYLDWIKQVMKSF